MKKIIAMIIVSILLTSCMDNDDKTTTIETPSIEIEENTGNNTEMNDDEIGKEIEILENEVVKDETKVEENENINGEQNIEVTSDEAALESEVNDLLDEFIDSLDSYDK